MKKGRNISVMMPYVDALKYFADWYARSPGRSRSGSVRQGRAHRVFRGQTPVKALGVTDQHSQLQLYTEGPDDKVVTFIGAGGVPRKRFEASPTRIRTSRASASSAGTRSKTSYTRNSFPREYALRKAGRPSQTVWLPGGKRGQHRPSFHRLLRGADGVFAGELLNIDAFDQPGVEEGKDATYAMLASRGTRRRRLNSTRAGRGARYIL